MIVLYQSLFYIIVFYYFIIVSCFHLSLASWLLFSNKVQFSSYESAGERIFKIGPHLPKLLLNIEGFTSWGQCFIRYNTIAVVIVNLYSAFM